MGWMEAGLQGGGMRRQAVGPVLGRFWAGRLGWMGTLHEELVEGMLWDDGTGA